MSEPDEKPVPPDLAPSATANSLRFLLNAASLNGPAASPTPILHLKQRLAQPDGLEWLQASFARPPFAPLRDPARSLLDGSLTLVELQALKERAKAGFAGEQPRELRLAAIAAYFFAIAAALAQRGVCITSKPLAELRTLLIDFAAAIAEPWSSLLSTAAFVEPTR